MSAISVGLVGRGMVSRYLVEALAHVPALKLVASCDKEGDRLENDRRTGLPVYLNAAEMIAVRQPDAIIVATPADTHLDLVRACLRARKHVLCEKPLAVNAQDAAQLAADAVENGLVLLTAFHRRYNRNYLELSRVTRQKRCLRIVGTYHEDIEEHSPFGGWRSEARATHRGCILDNGTNVFDLIYGIAGPFTVQRVEVVREEMCACEVRATIEIAFENDGHGSVSLDWRSAVEQKTLQVMFEQGDMTIDLLAGYSGFKASLAHEYEALLLEFAQRVQSGDVRSDERSVAVAKAVDAAYALVGG